MNAKNYFYNAFLFITLFSFLACTTKNFVSLTKVEQYYPSSILGMSQSDINKLDSIFYSSVLSNTIGKRLPKITVTDAEGREHDLRKALKSKCLIVSSNAYCGYGNEAITNVVPQAMKRINTSSRKTNIICLIVDPHDSTGVDPQAQNLLKALMYKYQDAYIIDESEARKLNLHANPTRLYLNDDHTVSRMFFGLPTTDSLCSEIHRFLF